MKIYLFFLFFFLSTSLNATSDIASLEDNSREILQTEAHDISHWLDQPEQEPHDFQGKFIHMLIILGLLVAFMYCASWALKRMMRARVMTQNLGNSIQLLESRALSARLTLHIVEVDGKKILISESPTSSSYITLHEEPNNRKT